jgi:predicted Mrr-cat superfamily restriction endonuclease
MADGDLVVLRVGTAKVAAVGQVVGNYEWHDGFGDVDGWNLQHVRRVRWLWKNPVSPKAFDT